MAKCRKCCWGLPRSFEADTKYDFHDLIRSIYLASSGHNKTISINCSFNPIIVPECPYERHIILFIGFYWLRTLHSYFKRVIPFIKRHPHKFDQRAEQRRWWRRRRRLKMEAKIHTTQPRRKQKPEKYSAQIKFAEWNITENLITFFQANNRMRSRSTVGIIHAAPRQAKCLLVCFATSAGSLVHFARIQ